MDISLHDNSTDYFGTVQLYMNPEESIRLSAISDDSSKSSSLVVGKNGVQMYTDLGTLFNIDTYSGRYIGLGDLGCSNDCNRLTFNKDDTTISLGFDETGYYGDGINGLQIHRNGNGFLNTILGDNGFLGNGTNFSIDDESGHININSFCTSFGKGYLGTVYMSDDCFGGDIGLRNGLNDGEMAVYIPSTQTYRYGGSSLLAFSNSDGGFGGDIINGIGINADDAYINFSVEPSGTIGSQGYGFRDNGGVIEYKDAGGSWVALNSLSGGGSDLQTVTDNGNSTTNGITIGNLDVSGAGTIVDAPTNANSSIIYDPTNSLGYYYYNHNFTISYRVYSYKDIGSNRIYSPNYTETSVTDNGNSDSNYGIEVSWDPVAGADGYRILINDPDNYGYNWDAGYDTTSTSFIDDSCNNLCFEYNYSNVTPTVVYSNLSTINGSLTVNGSATIRQGYLIFEDITNISQSEDYSNKFLSVDSNGTVGLYDSPIAVDGYNTLHSPSLMSGGNSSNSSFAIFLGYQAGQSAGFATRANFIGHLAGFQATSAYDSNFLGSNAGRGAWGANNSNFLGYTAGYLATQANNSNFFGNQAGYQATNAAHSNFFGQSAGQNASSASYANLLGYQAGYGAYAYQSNFLGRSAGYNASNVGDANFIGAFAGYSATNASSANFMGREAGFSADNASNSNFLGAYAGRYADNASGSNFFGNRAGHGASGASNANFIGASAGDSATNAASSVFIGPYAGYGAINASNSIFIGQSAGNTDSVNNTGNADDFSILIGKSTSTGGYSNSIAIGGFATNTAANQFMIGSTTRPITSMVLVGDYSGGSCTFAVGGMSCSSDEQLKTNIEDLSINTLANVISVRTVLYNWNNNPTGEKQIGFLAQDLQHYFPQLVSVGQGGYLQVNYAQMTPILVEAIREMNLKITTINDMTIQNTWRDSLIAWFGNVENGITEFFVGRAHMRELCIGEQNNETCLTKDQIDQLLQILPTEQYQTTNPVKENTSPAGEVVSETGAIDNGDTSTEEIVPESTVLVVETKPEPETEPQLVSENNSADTSEQ